MFPVPGKTISLCIVTQLSSFHMWGNVHMAGFTSSDQAVYGPFQSRLATTWTCHLANQRGALSHAQRSGSVYKAAGWSTRDSVLDASLSYGYNGISIASKISTDRPGSDSAGRSLINPRSPHDPAGGRQSNAGRPELPAGLAAEAVPVFRQFELVAGLGRSGTGNY
jgi:hypothetical protein